jgi:hypothetical protein
MGTRALTWLAALTALAALPAAAATKQLTEFDGAKLGASPAEVRKVFPKMEVTTENLGAQAFDSEFLTRYVIKSAPVRESGKPGVVELRFWKDKLWAIVVYFGAGNDDKVVASLTKRLGKPNGDNPQKPSWQGDKSQTFVETEHDWYSITDNALSKDAQAWFYARLSQMQQQLAPAAAAPQPPAATPAAAAPAAPAAPPAKK